MNAGVVVVLVSQWAWRESADRSRRTSSNVVGVGMKSGR
jgi:hypothetical protein